MKEQQPFVMHQLKLARVTSKLNDNEYWVVHFRGQSPISVLCSYLVDKVDEEAILNLIAQCSVDLINSEEDMKGVNLLARDGSTVTLINAFKGSKKPGVLAEIPKQKESSDGAEGSSAT